MSRLNIYRERSKLIPSSPGSKCEARRTCNLVFYMQYCNIRQDNTYQELKYRKRLLFANSGYPKLNLSTAEHIKGCVDPVPKNIF